MKTIVLTNSYSGLPLQIVKEAAPPGFDVVCLSKSSNVSLLRAAERADYLLAGGRTRVDRTLLDRAARLRMIQRSGVGLDSLDLEAIREKGIPLYVNQGVNAQSVAEHTLLLILACLRRLNSVDGATKRGVWNKQAQGVQTHELSGKTVGIIGMGSIAKALVRLLGGFGVRILYCSRTRMPADFEEENRMRFTDADGVFSGADIVTLHCALNDETRNLINAETIGRMKDGVIVVNTARGQMIDAEALASALRSGRVAYAGIDVHDEEPIRENYPLKDLDNVILTPHIAGVTYESFRAMMRDAMRNIALFDRGELRKIAAFRYM